jgi:hypothetical protein
MLPQHNTGLIPDISPNIWLGGSIPYQVVNESGDWRPYAPPHERQKDPIETMACVSFSLTNCLETQYKFYGVDVNFSDRFLAKMSGTQLNGNTLERVADTARNIGLVLESEWPNSPKAQTWAEYYKNIPDDVKAKARKQPFQYEWVARTNNFAESLKRELKQSPLQVTVYAPNPNHAVTLLYVSGTKAYIQDHDQQFKIINVSDIALALKVVLTPTMTNSLIVKNGTEWGIFDPATSPDGLITLMRNRGIPVPLKPDGTLDFDKLQVTKKLVDI